MERFVKGDIVVVPFPFSDLSSTKKRPALIIAKPEKYDILLAQITSKKIKNSYSILINEDDFQTGRVHIESNIKVNRLFSADSSIVKYKLGNLKKEKLKIIENKLIEYVKRN